MAALEVTFCLEYCELVQEGDYFCQLCQQGCAEPSASTAKSMVDAGITGRFLLPADLRIAATTSDLT